MQHELHVNLCTADDDAGGSHTDCGEATIVCSLNHFHLDLESKTARGHFQPFSLHPGSDLFLSLRELRDLDLWANESDQLIDVSTTAPTQSRIFSFAPSAEPVPSEENKTLNIILACTGAFFFLVSFILFVGVCWKLRCSKHSHQDKEQLSNPQKKKVTLSPSKGSQYVTSQNSLWNERSEGSMSQSERVYPRYKFTVADETDNSFMSRSGEMFAAKGNVLKNNSGVYNSSAASMDTGMASSRLRTRTNLRNASDLSPRYRFSIPDEEDVSNDSLSLSVRERNARLILAQLFNAENEDIDVDV